MWEIQDRSDVKGWPVLYFGFKWINGYYTTPQRVLWSMGQAFNEGKNNI